MADGLIAAVVRKAVAGQDNTTVVAIRVDPAKGRRRPGDDTRLARARQQGGEGASLPPHRQNGPQDVDPRAPRGPAQAGRDLARGGRGLLLFFAAAILLRSLQSTTSPHSRGDATSTPPARLAPPSGARDPDAPDTTGRPARQRIPAGPRRPHGPPRHRPDALPTPRPPAQSVPPTPQRALRRRRKSGPAAHAASNPRAASPTAAPDSQSLPACPARPGAQRPSWRRPGVGSAH
jgi:hypothetical protein